MKQESDVQFLEYVIKALVDNPNDVKITRTVDEMGVFLVLSLNPADMGKIIGRMGKTAEARPVSVGPTRNGETLIETGMAAGETVVVDGQVKLTAGAKVDAKPAGPAS